MSVAKDRQGSIFILFALSLTALFGMMALTIDLTRLFLAQSQLQSIADSCALAGIAVLPCARSSLAETTCSQADFSNALEAGQHIAQLNQDPQSTASVQIRFPVSNRVECQADLKGFIPALLQVFGVGVQELHAQAVATVWPDQGSCSPCGNTRFPGSTQSNGNLIPVIVQ